MFENMRKIILASNSPRRKELFQKLNVSFECIPSSYEEDMNKKLLPEELVKELALGKAVDVARKHPDATVVGADTIVVFNGGVHGKPHTKELAREMLCLYSGKCATVITGVAVVGSGKQQTKAFISKVYFKNFSEEDADNYVATGEPLDKAGSFAIQGAGRNLIERIECSFDTIVGLPVDEIREMLDDSTND